MRIKKVTKTLLERYKIMRLLFHRDRTYANLLVEGGLTNKQAVRALGRLLSHGLIRKEKINIATEKEPDFTDIGIAKSLLGVTEKRKKYIIEYHLTATGEKKLGWMEYTLQPYKYWEPTWAKDSSEYYKDIEAIIERENFFGIPPVS